MNQHDFTPSVHFVGVGGIGMSALARYFLAEGYSVTGSDATSSHIVETLRREGITVAIGHRAGNLPRKTNLLIKSQAVPEHNPELMAARKRGIITLSYPEAVRDLTQEYRTVAIAGAHGKSTTTALAALTLIAGGVDPTVIIGTNLKEFGEKKSGGTNFRAGKSRYLVLEADEFGHAFLHYSPSVVVVTNIDREHLDVYKNLANVKVAFLTFLSHTIPGGALILNRDDENLYSLRREIAEIAAQRNLRLTWYSLRDPIAKKLRATLTIMGTHNVSNALAAYYVGKFFAIPPKTIFAALGAYHGAWRRMEYRGKFRNALVYDDYAHHPTEIQATLKAFKEKYPSKTLVCVFQPHQSRRLKALFHEFAAAFETADETIILPIYKVAGRDEQPEEPGKFDSLGLVKSAWKRSPKKFILYLAEPKHLKKTLLKLPGPLSRKVIVMMGAGDVFKITDGLID